MTIKTQRRQSEPFLITKGEDMGTSITSKVISLPIKRGQKYLLVLNYRLNSALTLVDVTFDSIAGTNYCHTVTENTVVNSATAQASIKLPPVSGASGNTRFQGKLILASVKDDNVAYGIEGSYSVIPQGTATVPVVGNIGATVVVGADISTMTLTISGGTISWLHWSLYRI